MYIIECQHCQEANQINDKMRNSKIRCHLCKKVIQIANMRKTVISNVNTVNNHEVRIGKLENEMPEKTMWNGYKTKTDYSAEGFVSSIQRYLHHWFVFYLTGSIIFASIIIPLIILGIIGNAIGN